LIACFKIKTLAAKFEPILLLRHEKVKGKRDVLKWMLLDEEKAK